MVNQAKEVPTKKQLFNQMKIIYDMVLETREVVMNLTQRYEEMKLRTVSEWETITQVLEEEHGIPTDKLEEKLGDNFTKNVERYNEIVQERIKEMETQAVKQAEAVTQQAETFLKEEEIEVEVETEDIVE